MAAIQAALKLVIDGHQLCMFSYVGELSQDLEKDLPEIQGYAKIWNDFICLFYIIIVGTVEIKKDHAHPDGCTDVVTIAIAGQIVACIIGGVFCYFSWKNMRPRPAMHELPPGKSIWTIGFSQLATTICEIKRDYPDVFIYLCGLVFWCVAAVHLSSHLPVHLRTPPYTTSHVVSRTVSRTTCRYLPIRPHRYLLSSS